MRSLLKRREPSITPRADRAREAGQWQVAAGLYHIALDRNPRNPPIWVQYGHALKECGDLAQAENAYRTAIAYGPDDADAHLQLGHVLKLRGKTEGAEAAYQRALALDRSLQHAVIELAALARAKERSVPTSDVVGANPTHDAPATRFATMGRAGQRTDMAFGIDEACADHVSGWVVSPNGLKSIWISVDGNVVGRARTGIARPDVAARLPDVADGDDAGFLYVFRPEEFQNSVSSISVDLLENDGSGHHVRFVVPTIFGTGDDAPQAKPDICDSLSPFPVEIQRLLSSFAPGLYRRPDQWTGDLVQNAVSDLIWLVKRGSRTLSDLNGYVLYLKSLHVRFDAIAKRFPQFNISVGPESKDYMYRQTDPLEMLCISHHLRVLLSRGMQGALAEFGCFKGFSSACLSQACHELGIELHVFDSFAGLPPSDSVYYKTGEFSSSIEEVSQNIRTFGKIENVRFFRGFFSSTVARYREAPLAVWMDVDLASSARDVTGVLAGLSPSSILFTHECVPASFSYGEILAAPGPDDVLTPVVSEFRSLGRDPVGCFLAGCMGAIWDRERGVPPLGIESILALCNAL
jgi:O-methyltransferase